MSSFSEFSKNAGKPQDKKNNSKKTLEDIAKNRIDPSTGNEREDREDVVARDFHEVNDTPNTRSARDSMSNRSQNGNERTTSRI